MPPSITIAISIGYPVANPNDEMKIPAIAGAKTVNSREPDLSDKIPYTGCNKELEKINIPASNPACAKLKPNRCTSIG